MIRVFDFFSGCGGTSQGFAEAGLEVVFGLDIDKDSASTFRRNFPRADFINGDIRDFASSDLARYVGDSQKPMLFCGCAPCQPFSKQNRQKSMIDPRSGLLEEFMRFVDFWRPDYVVVENVPGMQKLSMESGPLKSFTNMLTANGYLFVTQVVPALWYGVPQTRERLLLMASKSGPCLAIPPASHGIDGRPVATVRDWIFNLPPIAAGQEDTHDDQHVAACLSDLNLKRIAATPEGGSRESWPESLWLKCHRGHRGHSDVYGRLSWDRPAAGLTTRCISYSNGRFGHPVQNRAISVREAACLQTFPRDYFFAGSLASRARQIGNAVPPLMARRIGMTLLEHANAIFD